MKKVGSNWYVHKSNIKELFYFLEDFWQPYIEKTSKMVTHNYEIIKIDRHKMSISYIDSHDWNISREPEVGMCTKFGDFMSYEFKVIPPRKNNKQIYHSKELFVSSDYKGFDLNEAKRRTEEWNSIPGIKDIKNKIGNKNYWVELLKANGMEV